MATQSLNHFDAHSTAALDKCYHGRFFESLSSCSVDRLDAANESLATSIWPLNFWAAMTGAKACRMRCDNYDGVIELEKKYEAGNGTIAMSGIIFLADFVVSTNEDSKPFILAKEAQPNIVWETNNIAGSFYRTIVSTNTGQYAVVDSSKEAVTLYDKADHVIWTTNIVMGLRSDPVMGERKISGMQVYKGDLWVNVGRGYAIVAIKTGDLKGFDQN